MGTVEQSTRQVVASIRFKGEGVEQHVAAAMSRLAGEAARAMRSNAPKYQSTLTDSIKADVVTPLHYVVGAHVAHAAAVELGRKPGKALPRFFDPAAADVVKWLETKAFAGVRKPKSGSKKFTLREMELRYRYLGLSRKVKAKGIAAQPFAQPVVDGLKRTMPQRVGEAVRAALLQNGGGGVA